MYTFTSVLISLFLTSVVYAKTPVSNEGSSVTPEDTAEPSVQPAVNTGTVDTDTDSDQEAEKNAQQYFRKEPSDSESKPAAAAPLGPSDHYLALHMGGFLSSDAYQWGQTPHVSNSGQVTAGLTYRIGALSSLADWAIRADFTTYQLTEGKPVQLAVLPMLMFPDSGSQFPLYFGLGLGPGIFLSQLQNESALSLAYELIAGARLFNVVGKTGFFLESGLKNNVLLFSDGQFNGLFLAAGALFVF